MDDTKTPPPADPAAPPADPTKPATGDDDKPLGPPGEKALEAIKEERRVLKEQLRSWSDLGVKPEEVAELLKTREGEAERQARREMERAAIAKANERLLAAEVRAAAKGVLADPADALKFLDLSTVEVGDDGTVDSSAIEAAIGDLVKSKPYLAAAQGVGSWGSADPGPRNGDVKGQITREQLKSMSPEQIDQARREGRLARLMGATA